MGVKLYKMSYYYSKQPWYDKNGTYELIHKYEDRCIRHFGVDCEWKNIVTGESLNVWYKVMETLPKEEIRNIKLSMLNVK